MVQSFAPVPATGGFADALRGLGHSLETDERLNGAVNGYARRAVVGAINDYGGTVVTLVSRSEEHTSELQSLMRSSYAVFCLKNKNQTLKYLEALTDMHE